MNELLHTVIHGIYGGSAPGRPPAAPIDGCGSSVFTSTMAATRFRQAMAALEEMGNEANELRAIQHHTPAQAQRFAELDEQIEHEELAANEALEALVGFRFDRIARVLG